jgi:hypothetical protein
MLEGSALHAVIYNKKKWNLADALADYESMMGKKNFHRETGVSYRLRVIPKTKFNKSSFRTKKLKDKSLIFGELLPQHKHLSMTGSGFFSKIKSVAKNVVSKIASVPGKIAEQFSRRHNYNNTSKRTLDNHKDEVIVKLIVVRTPILAILDKVFNVLTFGSWAKAKSESNYDKMFHLQLRINDILVEKNEVINITENLQSITDKSEQLIVSSFPSITIGEFMKAGEDSMGTDYWLYNAFKNNCQNFIMGLLSANGCLTDEAKIFIYQPVEELVKRIPRYMNVIAKSATGIGAVANRLMGKGEDGRFELSDTGGVPWNGKWKFLHNKQYFQKRIDYLRKKYKGYYLTNYYLKDVDDGTGHMKYMSNVRANAEAYDRANPQSLADGFKNAFNVIKMPLSLIPGVGQALDVADEIIGSGNFDEGMFGHSTQNRTVLPPRKKQGAGKRYEEAHIEDGRHVLGRWVDDVPIKPRNNRYASQEEIKAMNGTKYDPNDHTEELARNKKFLEDFAKNGGGKKELTEDEKLLRKKIMQIKKGTKPALEGYLIDNATTLPDFRSKNKKIEEELQRLKAKGVRDIKGITDNDKLEKLQSFNFKRELKFIVENATRTTLLSYILELPEFQPIIPPIATNEFGRTEAEQIEYNIRKAIKKDLIEFILSMPELAKLYIAKEPKVKLSKAMLASLGIVGVEGKKIYANWTDEQRKEKMESLARIDRLSKAEIVKTLRDMYSPEQLRKLGIRISKSIEDLKFDIASSGIPNIF